MKINILESTLSDDMAFLYDKFENSFGFGPCGAYSAYLRSMNMGDIAVCIATDGDIEFPHYVIVQQWGDTLNIIDFTNPFDNELTYSEIDILGPDEMPEMVDNNLIEWFRNNV